jgi:2-dehydropantoate 2-reductase
MFGGGSMRVVVLGAGALGSLVGGLLASRHEVVLVGRKAHVAAIKEGGLAISGATRRRVRPDAVESPAGLAAPDLLLVTVKAYDTEAALSGARRLIGPNTVVLSLQNGITTLDVLRKVVPRGRLVAGWTSHGAWMAGPGSVTHAGAGDLAVGELDGGSTSRIRALAEAFTSAGLVAKVSTDIERELWLKGLVNCAINPLTALARCENGRIAADPGLSRVARAICGEGAAVARAMGFAITESEAHRRVVRVAWQTARNRSSMLRDVESGKVTEIDYLNGAVAELASAHGLRAPLNESLTAIVRALSEDAGATRGN